MSFVNLSAAWWLLLALPIVALHMLRLRRKRVTVPSTLLWARALEEIEANAPLRRLRKSLLLLLQLAVLAALTAALMRPLWRTDAEIAGRAVLVVDASASMGAVESDGASRLAEAKRRARELLDTLGSGDALAIVESGASVVVRSPMTEDRARLEAALDGIPQSDAPGRIADALLLARELARAEQADSIVVLTDGVEQTSASPLDGPSARVIRIGTTSDNLAITALSARVDPAEPSRRQLFTAVESFSSTPRGAIAELSLGGGVRDVRRIDLAPGERRGVVFDLDATEIGLAEVRLRPAEGFDPDALAADDLAYVYLPDERRLRVVVASENAFLLRVLAANPRLSVTAAGGAPPGEPDLLVAEGKLPEGWAEARAPLLVAGPVREPGLWDAGVPVEAAPFSAWDAGHPINAFLNYADVRVARATSLGGVPWLRPVARGGATGLVWAGARGDRRVVVLAFDLLESDLPLRVEFPVLLANATEWLVGEGGPPAEREARTGMSIPIRAESERVLVRRPDGGSDAVDIASGMGAYAGADRVGIYRLEAASSASEIGVSLLDPAESAIQPRDLVTSASGVTATPEATEARTSEREVWPYVLPAALALLLLEWALYHRRIA